MPDDVTVSQDVDTFLKSATKAVARTNLGLGTAAQSAVGDFATSTQGDLADTLSTTKQDILTEGAFVDGDKTKLDGITGTNTGDQDLSGLQSILTEGAFVDGDKTKLDGITGTNTGDQDLSGLQSILTEGAFVDGDKTKLDGITGTNTGDQDLSALATKANVLELDNTVSFTPSADFHPATKKYVDDNAGGGPSGTTLSGTTANATPTEIFVDGTSPNRVDVATGSTITFSALVAARSATESAGYKIEGVIKNDAGTAELVGVVAKTVFAEEDTAWDITVTAANNALTFIVTGDSADSVSWEVTLNKTEAA